MTKLGGVPYDKSLGVVTQKDGDTGDSAQRTATLAVLLFYTSKSDLFAWIVAKKMIEALKVGRGRYVRSPVKGYWGNDPTNFSRDQHSILMLALAVTGYRDELWETFSEILKRGGFHQNFLRGTDDPERRWKMPDFLAPTEISVFIRGMGWKLLYPLLVILDLGFLLDLLLRKNRPWDYDNMLAQNLMYAVTCLPTFVSKFAFKKYALSDFRERLENYYDTTSGNGIEGMAELYIKAFDSVWRDL